jgi:hypothetical protein
VRRSAAADCAARPDRPYLAPRIVSDRGGIARPPKG